MDTDIFDTDEWEIFKNTIQTKYKGRQISIATANTMDHSRDFWHNGKCIGCLGKRVFIITKTGQTEFIEFEDIRAIKLNPQAEMEC